MSTLKTLHNRANDALHGVCIGYHLRIPLSEMFDASRIVGEPVDEAGEPWQGFLCGREGRADIDLQGSREVLHLQWYKLENGNFEVNAYIS